MKTVKSILMSAIVVISVSAAQNMSYAEEKKSEGTSGENSLIAECQRVFAEFGPSISKDKVDKICSQSQHFDTCVSVEGKKIFHLDKASEKPSPKKILMFSVIHGDEKDAGILGVQWLNRLFEIEGARNSWRVIPLLSPDGYRLKTRTNAHGVDLNRNFPTQDWDQAAQDYWKTKMKSNPRRFPGDKAGSEPETRCAIRHIEDYQPDLILSVHTPLGVLDFDGPTNHRKPATFLPWKSLGHLPGSLGRYMWMDRKKPVMTVELRSSTNFKNLAAIDKLQDMLGNLAIEVSDMLEKKPTP